MAKNKELNQWASLKKATQIRPEHVERNEIGLFKAKGRNEALKRKILQSLYGEPSDDETTDVVGDDQNKKTATKVTVQNVENFKLIDNDEPSFVDGEERVVDKPDKRKKKRKLSDSNVAEKKVKKIKITETTNDNDATENATIVVDATAQVKKTIKKPLTAKKNGQSKMIQRKYNLAKLAVGMKKTKTSKTGGGGGGGNKKNAPTKSQTSNATKKGNDKKQNGISDERLRAFGINPKKYHKKQKWESGGGQKKQKIGESPVTPKKKGAAAANRSPSAGAGKPKNDKNKKIDQNKKKLLKFLGKNV